MGSLLHFFPSPWVRHVDIYVRRDREKTQCLATLVYPPNSIGGAWGSSGLSVMGLWTTGHGTEDLGGETHASVTYQETRTGNISK